MTLAPCPDRAVTNDTPLPGMVGEHPLMECVYGLARRAAPTDLPVVIVGETGTGKELVARALHALSPRARRPFVAVNAAAVPESLFESELFGHEAGAFSDAKGAKAGLLEAAHGGSFFCDELPALPGSCQAKLLRVVEEGTLRRVGGVRARPAAPRWIAACQQWDARRRRPVDLREDLWQRLAGVVIHLPPLRERAADIPALAAHFLASLDHGALRFTDDALALLAGSDWPGNVRELRQVVARLVLAADRGAVDAAVVDAASVRRELETSGDREALGRRITIESALLRDHWNVLATARALHVSRSTLHRWIRALGVRRPGRVSQVSQRQPRDT